MVKIREPKASTAHTPSNTEIEAFASGADGGDRELNKNATRNFKTLTVPFNEYEYSMLQKLSESTHRSMLSAIRWAIIEAIETKTVSK